MIIICFDILVLGRNFYFKYMRKIILSLTLCLSSLLVQGQIIKGCIISIEDNKAYLDVTAPDVQVGDVLSVYTEGGYIIHPITKKKIQKEGDVLANLEIVDTKSEYSVATISPEGAFQKIEVGMFARMSESASEMRRRMKREGLQTSEIENSFSEAPENFSTADEVLEWHFRSTGLDRLENIPFKSYLIETNITQKNEKGRVLSSAHLTKIADVPTNSVYVKNIMKLGRMDISSISVVNNGSTGWIRTGKKPKQMKAKMIPLYLTKINYKDELLCAKDIYSRTLCGERFIDGKTCIGIEFINWKTGETVKSYFDKTNGLLVAKSEKGKKGKEIISKVLVYKTFFDKISLPSVVQIETDKGHVITIETLQLIPDYVINGFQFSIEFLKTQKF